MKCNKCNCYLDKEYKFCPNCGSEITMVSKVYDPFEVPEKMPTILKVSLIAIILFFALIFGTLIFGSMSYSNYKNESNVDYEYDYDYNLY